MKFSLADLQFPPKSLHRLGMVEGTESRLQSMMSLIDGGCPKDLVTPLCRDRDRSELVDEVLEVIDVNRLPMWLREVEVHQSVKAESSLSIREPGSAPFEKGLATLGELREFSPDGVSAKAATRFVFEAMRGSVVEGGWKSLQPLQLDTWSSVKDSFQGSTGFGWPYCSSKKEWLDECADYSVTLFGRIQAVRELQPCGEFPYLMGTRSGATKHGENPKWRIIFQGSRVIANLEKMVQAPVLRALRGVKHFAAWGGKYGVDAAITRLLTQGWCLSVDFQNFDASVPPAVIHCCFGVLHRMFGGTTPIHRLLAYLERQFVEGDLVTPWRLIRRASGIPSGSVLTNLIGSMANMWMMAYSAHRLGFSIQDCEVQGDDGVYVFRNNFGVEPIDLKELTDVLQADLGVAMHPDKQFYADNEVHFLQNVHRRSFTEGGVSVGVRPIMRVLGGMLSYERYHKGWSGKLDTIRWWQQMENACSHPCFRNFCAWVLSKDKYSSLGIDEVIARAGGLTAVESVLGARTEWSNKVPIRSLRNSRTAVEMAGLVKSGASSF
jgi:hypothetical protein